MRGCGASLPVRCGASEGAGGAERLSSNSPPLNDPYVATDYTTDVSSAPGSSPICAHKTGHRIQWAPPGQIGTRPEEGSWVGRRFGKGDSVKGEGGTCRIMQETESGEGIREENDDDGD